MTFLYFNRSGRLWRRGSTVSPWTTASRRWSSSAANSRMFTPLPLPPPFSASSSSAPGCRSAQKPHLFLSSPFLCFLWRVGCRQGVLVSGTDEGRFLLDDGSDVVELLLSTESQPQQWKIGRSKTTKITSFDPYHSCCNLSHFPYFLSFQGCTWWSSGRTSPLNPVAFPRSGYLLLLEHHTRLPRNRILYRVLWSILGIEAKKVLFSLSFRFFVNVIDLLYCQYKLESGIYLLFRSFHFTVLLKIFPLGRRGKWCIMFLLFN